MGYPSIQPSMMLETCAGRPHTRQGRLVEEVAWWPPGTPQRRRIGPQPQWELQSQGWLPTPVSSAIGPPPPAGAHRAITRLPWCWATYYYGEVQRATGMHG